MVKLLKYFTVLFILSIVLVACGTSSETNSANGSTKETEEQLNEEADQIEGKTNEENNKIEENTDQDIKVNQPTDKVDENDKKSESDNGETTPASELQISYSINGETCRRNNNWKKSDNQAFGLYILPSYELTGEEPNNDSLYFKENDQHLMRIQILPSDSSIESLKENTLVQLEASLNSDVETLSPPAGFSKDTTMMQTKNDKEIVTALLIKDHDHIIKLLIFTKNQENHLDAFLQMAKHIKVN